MTNTELLEKAIDDSGLKREYIAEKCGITRQSLASKINNKSLFTAKEIGVLCEVLRITDLKIKEAIFFAG